VLTDYSFSVVKPTRCTIYQIYFIFGTALFMFRTVSLSIIRSLILYIQHQVYVTQVLWLLSSKQPQNSYDIYLMLYVQYSTSDDGRRVRPKHVECCPKNKINLRYCASGWFYYINTRCDPKVFRRVVLKEYCALHLAADTVTT